MRCSREPSLWTLFPIPAARIRGVPFGPNPGYWSTLFFSVEQRLPLPHDAAIIMTIVVAVVHNPKRQR